MKIRNIKLKSPYILSPMAGFTDCAFRSLCSSFDCGLTVTEMVSARGLLYKGEGSKALLYHEDNESPKSVQLFSNEPEVIAEVVASGVLDDYDIIDINMGCPMPKIVKEGMGSALLLNPKLASEVITSCVENTQKPVTVKFRIGYDKNNIIAKDFAKMCEDSGASAICVHGRTKTQLYSGKADWDVIGDVANSVSIPVIGNGDIESLEQADEMMKIYGVSGVAIGRAALGKPWIFSTDKNLCVDIPTVIKTHFEILQKYYSQRLVLLHMRKHLACYIKDVKKAKQYRHKIVTSENMEEIYNLIDEVFSKWAKLLACFPFI